jgi:hypothetical protein
MKLFAAILLLSIVLFLTGCADLWLISYKLKGGYYDRKPLKYQNYATGTSKTPSK